MAPDSPSVDLCGGRERSGARTSADGPEGKKRIDLSRDEWYAFDAAGPAYYVVIIRARQRLVLGRQGSRLPRHLEGLDGWVRTR